MRVFLKKKLIENPKFLNDEASADSVSAILESHVYEKKQSPNIYRNSISGMAMKIMRSTKASEHFDYNSLLNC
jgi:hypothetical protein